jgi:hypothetical protein
MWFFFGSSVLMISLKRFLNGIKNQTLIVFPNVWQPFKMSGGTSSNFSLQSHVTHLSDTVDSGNLL